jgi:hypothetical protein
MSFQDKLQKEIKLQEKDNRRAQKDVYIQKWTGSEQDYQLREARADRRANRGFILTSIKLGYWYTDKINKEQRNEAISWSKWG